MAVTNCRRLSAFGELNVNVSTMTGAAVKFRTASTLRHNSLAAPRTRGAAYHVLPGI